MIWIAASLYVLGIVGAAAAVSRDADGRNVPSGPREWIVIIGWPLAVGAAICLGLFSSVRKAIRP
jgi:hypothetical protein